MIALILTTLVLFVAGGCIALLGDRLGTYVGKKRISKFGLRPRQTAMLYTFWSGAIIALLVTLLLIWLNNDYARAIQDRRELKKNIVTLESNIRKSQQALADAVAQITKANEDLRKAETRKIQAEQALLAAQKNLTALQKHLTGTQAKLAGTQAQLAASQSAVAARQRDLTQAQAQLTGVNARLRSTSDSLRSTMANLNATVDDLSTVRVEAKKLTVRNKSLRTDNEKLAVKNSKLVVTNEALIQQNATLVTRPLIYRSGGELGRTTIDATQSPEAIQKNLVAWLEDLSVRARKDGAALGPNDRAIEVVNPPLDNPEAAKSTGEEIVRTIVDAISKDRFQHPSVAVIARAKYNTAIGEQVRVYLYPYQNVVVFRAEQVIKSTIIDGTQNEDVILRALQSFLTNTVQPYAIDEGVIKKIDPKTGEVTAGQVVSSWVDVVKEIRAVGAQAHVDAIAESDTTSVQPLRLRLVVSPNGASPAAPR
ncbi:MAG: DUF3084 domain-containing protein [Capsulimonas sp.]|uniref:DUF3084 domain-containing protein n=1 Tax=Capsulimonas sp. TaxID=2494211 RepID=UPI003265B3D7